MGDFFFFKVMEYLRARAEVGAEALVVSSILGTRAVVSSKLGTRVPVFTRGTLRGSVAD